MNLYDELLGLVDVLEKHGIEYALCGGLAVGCFLTAWVYLNTRQVSHTDQFGVVFGFDRMMVATSNKEVDEFEAVRRLRVKDEKGQPKEVTVPFKIGRASW